MIESPVNLPSQEYDNLVRCLNLTQSDTDDEALNAIRAANRILQANDLTWERVWEHIERRMLQKAITSQMTVDEALESLLSVLKPGDFRQLITQFQKKWADTGMLSVKQRQVISDSLEGHDLYIKRKPPTS